MIDLHTHSVFSDGELIPAEIARRASVKGYQALAVTDHADESNLYFLLQNLVPGVKKLAPYVGLELFVGVELTHVPPGLIEDMVRQARLNKADIVLVHGETIVEPVEQGTNLAAIEAGVEILAHPGLIGEEEVRLAAQKNVALEISTRKGHSLTNGHVAALARKYGAKMVINNDAHAPKDLVNKQMRQNVALGAGMSNEELCAAEKNSRDIVDKLIKGSLTA